jgi:hypothetical protein
VTAEVDRFNAFAWPPGNPDTSLYRAAAGVMAVGTWPPLPSGTPGWLQNTAGEAALAAAGSNATAALGNTNLVIPNLIAGRSYRLDAFLQLSNTTPGEGAKLDLGGGTVEASNFVLAAVADNGTAVPGTTVATSLTGAINWSSITGTMYVSLKGFITVGTGGSLILRLAENTSSTGTVTLAAGSWIALADTVTM